MLFGRLQMSQCLTSSQILLFLDAQLSPHQRESVEAHLNGCSVCRQLIAALIRDSVEVAKRGISESEPSAAADEELRALSLSQHETATSLVRWTRGSTIADRYVVLDELGAGAAGVVYSAFDRKLDRKLALKFVRAASDQTEEGNARLLREGQSLARLSHPNVVAIYDVGSFERLSYIAMELIEGRSLRQWLAQEKPSWRRTLAVFVDAARGLLAAHKAGLVHRDFKPDNVLIAWDGRVCVSDFGLTHMLSGVADPLAKAKLDAPAQPEVSPPSTIAGTPAYMAPEQYRALPIDGRADQFAFCASLYEALYGVRPFAGETAEALMNAVSAGKVRLPPRSVRVPSFLNAAVLRGLQPRPEERFPSMAELIDVLIRGPQRRRLQLGAVVFASLLVAGGASAWQFRAKPCQGAEAQLAGVWDTAQKQLVLESFEKTGLSYASAACQRLRQQVDAYAERWISARTDVCQAANVRREISPALLDRRMACLDQRLYELKVTAGLLAKADAALVERADKLASRLRGVEDCSSAAILDSRVPPPPPEVAEQVNALRQRLSEIAVLEEAGRYAEGLKKAQIATREAAALGYQPLLAKAEISLGTLQSLTGDTAHAAETLRTALADAEASADDKDVLSAWLKLSRFTILGKWDFKLAADYVQHAESFAKRAGTDRERAELFSMKSSLLNKNGQFREALQAVEQGMASAARAYGPESPQMAVYLTSLGGHQVQIGDTEAGLRNYARALAIAERTLGPGHPSLIHIHDSHAIALGRAFRYDEALDAFRRAHHVAEQVYPLTHSRRQTYLLNVIYAAVGGARYEEAEPLVQKWLAIDAQATDHVPELIIGAYGLLASAQHGQGRRTEALKTLEQALGRLKEFPEEGSLRGELLSQIAGYEMEAGELGAALAHYQQSVAIEEKLIPNLPDFSTTLTGLGKLYLARREPAIALRHLERALIVCERSKDDRGMRNGPYFALAQALVRSGGDRTRAKALAEQARGIWQRCGLPCRTELTAVDTWLQKLAQEGS